MRLTSWSFGSALPPLSRPPPSPGQSCLVPPRMLLQPRPGDPGGPCLGMLPIPMKRPGHGVHWACPGAHGIGGVHVLFRQPDVHGLFRAVLYLFMVCSYPFTLCSLSFWFRSRFVPSLSGASERKENRKGTGEAPYTPLRRQPPIGTGTPDPPYPRSKLESQPTVDPYPRNWKLFGPATFACLSGK